MTDLSARLDSEKPVILDGAMGTMIQSYKLNEQDFCGDNFPSHRYDLQGNNDILCLTQPDIVREIHQAYFNAGAHIVETNTFSANAISQSDYGTEDLIYEINLQIYLRTSYLFFIGFVRASLCIQGQKCYGWRNYNR